MVSARPDYRPVQLARAQVHHQESLAQLQAEHEAALLRRRRAIQRKVADAVAGAARGLGLGEDEGLHEVEEGLDV